MLSKILLSPADLREGPTLILSPHADDELIGAGGWLLLTRGSGSRRVVVVCAHCDSQRTSERDTAYTGLELSDLVDLDLEEGAGNHWDSIVVINRLARAIKELRPTYILAPNASDPHPDHLGARRLLAAALAQGWSAPLLIAEYEGFRPLRDANRWLNITAVAEEKWLRLQAFTSQEERYGLSEVASHLNAYRGRTLFLKGISFAEAYQVGLPSEYAA